ncbi:serine/threonine-protein kinase PBL20 [Populus alba x Populus x berolinensis]|nr:serine/threonine-protein kinase PBL20 [Populus alba x Populus x berolinensis]
MPNRSLEDHLFKRGPPTLSWRKRLEIILGAAQGLAYLHGGMEVQPQLYRLFIRDFKSSNVLLDKRPLNRSSLIWGLLAEGPDGW